MVAICLRRGLAGMVLAAGLMTTKDVHGELSDVVAGKVAGRSGKEEITIFDTTGSAIQDAAAAALVYENAVARGLGQMVNLYE